MIRQLLLLDYPQITFKRFLVSLFATAVLNTVIAVVLTAIGFGTGFAANFVFSQCIGLSIYFSNVVFTPLFRAATRLSVQIAVIGFAILIGAAAGTLLGVRASGMDIVAFLARSPKFFGQVILLGLLFGAVISFAFFLLGTIAEEKMRRFETEKNTMEAELRLLQSQMEPHFLFNTLATVLSLMDSDLQAARRMLESLTSFLRASLVSGRERTVPLFREMDLVRTYLDLMTSRMGDRLRYRLDLPDELRNFPVPPLVIQPLAENAVKYGLEPSVQGGEIAIRALRESDAVRITVSDSGPGMQEHGKGSGVSLENIRKRLALLYGGKGRLVIEENSPTGVRVKIEIPFES